MPFPSSHNFQSKRSFIAEKLQIARKPIKLLSTRQKFRRKERQRLSDSAKRNRTYIRNSVLQENADCNSINVATQSNVNCDSCNESSDSSDCIYYEETFQEKLASCFVEINLTHVQGNSILHLLRSHSCFHNLPKDIRTIVNTPREPLELFQVEPGEYLHFNIETKIIECLKKASLKNVTVIELDISTDGCTLDKSNTMQIWPIQCRIANYSNTKPIVAGIYRGPNKPNDANKFFKMFVKDINTIINNGGIRYHKSTIEIKLRCFVADAPARAFILNHRGHMAMQPCSKCKVCGVYNEGRFVFNTVDHVPRTDEEYGRLYIGEDHHKEGRSPLSLLPLGMVSQVPFEYMHLVCLGVTKKLITAWVSGKYNKQTKLSGALINTANNRLKSIAKYCPYEFARRPRFLNDYTKYKATECRQFLIYTGPVVMINLLNDNVFKHFLMLHAAIRILLSNSPCSELAVFAEVALKKFVFNCQSLYGPTFASYNVHGLLHLADDFKRYGSLNSFSAFPFENNMSIFKKYCRKPVYPLQQLFNRFTELNIHDKRKTNTVKCPSGSVKWPNFILSCGIRDNCCILLDGSICIIVKIVKIDETYNLLIRKFLNVSQFYDVGIPSVLLDVYKCQGLSADAVSISLNQVRGKCYKMPLATDTIFSNFSSSDEDENEVDDLQYIVALMIHTDE
ncbi:uncharacterized protein [Prorops nasuta]|uniref:uncharacterized protein n=1 Tax=Prorops nasuta TaxID=863751 RepID=UPI0034CF256E